MNTLEIAMSLLDRGYAVFPVVYGMKIPATRQGFLDASTDRQQIINWFAGRKFNIGIATGRASKLVVIDLDLYKEETAGNWELLLERLGPLPRTYAVTTRAGGTHLYFRLPEGVDLRSYNGQLAKGVDLRANGGYVLAEGGFCRTDKYGPAGEYTATDLQPVQGLPEAWVSAWLALNARQDALAAKKAAKTAQEALL